jgi:hypothetical protein
MELFNYNYIQFVQQGAAVVEKINQHLGKKKF